jgi:two-component system chemotaxis sensor kinase CheA
MAEKFDIDPQLLADFLSESIETLDGLDSLFVMLEEKPDDQAIVNQIFRPIHSIKGNSSFFGLVNIKNFSHSMENILQEVRSMKRHATKPLIDALLQGVDLLRGMMDKLATGDLSTEFRPEELAHLEKLESITKSEEASLADMSRKVRDALAAIDESEITGAAAAKLREAREAIGKIVKALVPSSGSGADQDQAMVFLIRGEDVTHSIRVIGTFVRELAQACELSERCDAFLQELDKLLQVSKKHGDETLVSGLTSLQTDFVTIHDSGIGFDDLMRSLITERLEAVMAGVEAREKNAPPPPPPAPEKKAQAAEAPGESKAEAKEDSHASKTIRIEEEKVDSFMSFVGELIIASEVFAYIQKKLSAHPEVRLIAQEFKNANLSFNELSNNLQKSLMAVRRIPLRNALQKLPRLVRDTASHLGKDVDLVMNGQDIQVDKSLLEGLESPLVHMVRNSVDHGIELPEERRAAGKPETGTITVSAEATEETFTLKIIDDGKGLDVEAIKAKAVAKGTITEETARTMSDQEAFRLVFGAGISTAKVVTEVSGRGVGMDVVFSNIEKMNGRIQIESEYGKGSTFIIVLPMTVTLLVIDGLVARVGRENYIIPITAVRESIRPVKGQISTISGKGEVMNVRGELHRMLRLNKALNIKSDFDNPADATVVLIEGKAGTCGLMVDELLGQQSVVLKNLGKQFENLRVIQGGAILGDGRVGLVLDTDGVLESSAR